MGNRSKQKHGRIGRRRFLQKAAGGAGALMLSGAVSLGSEMQEKPNILVILTDQQHAGMMSCAGNEYIDTPAIDSIAASGTRFDRAYCTSPVCVPSRTSLVSGHMPGDFGIERNGQSRKHIPERVLQRMIGPWFKRAGYEVAYGGKVHTAREMTESIQDSSRGFRFITGDQREKLAAKSAEFIGQSHESPWLLVSSFMNPHDICYMAIEDMADKPLESMGYHARLGAGPLHAAMRNPEGVSDEEFFARHCPPAPSNLEVPPEEPEMYKNLFARREFRKWARENWSEKRWRRYRWAYGNLTERVDGHIGRVLQALRRSGQAENTIVVFTSDHGDMDAAHRLEHKTVPYEEAARIPLLINDGRRPGGTSVNSRLVSNGLDLFPTLCDYAGIDAPPELKGYSLRPLCEGRRPRKWRDHLVVQTRVGRMLRTERHKYIICKKGKHREQLVDLKNDPGEMRNLVGDAAHGDVLTQHRRMLWQWVQKNNDKTAQEYLVRPV